MANIFKTITNTIKYWWIPGLIGLILIIVGIYCFTIPEGTYNTLADVFSLAFLFIGLAEIYFSISNRESLSGWGWYLTGGILSLLAGLVLLINPHVSEMILPYFFALMLLFRSIQGLGISFDLKNHGILQWGNLAIISILGILFSFLLLIYPLFTEAILVTFTGLAFIFVGVVGVVIGFTLYRIKRFPKRLSKNLRNRIEEVQKEIQKEVKDFRMGAQESLGELRENIDQLGDSQKK